MAISDPNVIKAVKRATRQERRAVRRAQRLDRWDKFWPRDKRVKFWRRVRIGCDVLAVVGVAITLGVVVRLVVLTGCTNAQLSARQGASDDQLNAQIVKADADVVALRELVTATNGVAGQAALAHYTKNAADLKNALHAVQAKRNAHPFGEC